MRKLHSTANVVRALAASGVSETHFLKIRPVELEWVGAARSIFGASSSIVTPPPASSDEDQEKRLTASQLFSSTAAPTGMDDSREIRQLREVRTTRLQIINLTVVRLR